MKKFIPPGNWSHNSDGTYIGPDGDRFDANGNHIPFTKNPNVKHPGAKERNETLGEYRKRVDVAVAAGFHLGDLSWSSWHNYCHGDRHASLYEIPQEEPSSRYDDEDEW